MERFSEKTLLQVGDVIGKSVFPFEDHNNEEGAEMVHNGREAYIDIALLPHQTHSINVAIAEHIGQNFPETDALVTFRRNLPIGVVTADCVPIMVYSPDVEGVAIIHAGWRGTLGGIVDRTIDVLTGHGAKPSEMIVAFGASISEEMYEVDEALADKFREAGFSEYVSYIESGIGNVEPRIGNIESKTGNIEPGTGKPHIDLQGVNRERLIRKGVRPEKIAPNPDCTYSTAYASGKPVYQSHRRSKGAPGRNLTTIVMRYKTI